METEKVNRRALTYAQRRLIDIRLHEVCREIDIGLCRYDEGHTDQSIAAEMNFNCSPSSVMSMRQDFFGKLAGGGARGNAALLARIASLELQVEQIETRLDVWHKLPVD